MTGGPRGDGEKPTVSSKNPHFFKIILEETLKENKLRVPQYFVKKCGETLTESVSVDLPCGSKWKMKLKNLDGKFWLEKGWPEFAKHYNIGRGHMLIFRYDGNSELHAVIFDTSTVEIDYPPGPVHFDECNIVGKLPAPKREVIDNDFIEIMDDCSPCHNRGLKFSLQCSPPPKRMKTSPSKTQSNVSHLRAEGSYHNKTVVENRMCRGNSSSKPDVKGKHKFLARSCRDESRQKKSNIPGGMKPLMGHIKYAALQKASGFKSQGPFFKIVMQPSYVHGNRLTIPSIFATRYIKNKSCNVILKVLGGRTWFVKYRLGVYDRARTARFRSGWKEFCWGNNLEVGDVCVFVLLKDIKIAFEVTIFRVNGNSKTLMSSAHVGGAIVVKPEQSLVNEITESGDAINEETSTPITHKCLPAKQAKGCISTPLKTRKQHSLNFIKKAKILERAPFESEKPFFKFVIKSSYAYTSAAYHLYVPLDFAVKYIKNEGDCILSVPNGRSWSAQFKFRSRKNGRRTAEICGGWKDFKLDNRLIVGDMCIFELLNGTKISFEVSIVRAGTRGRESAKGASKQNGGVIVKTEID